MTAGAAPSQNTAMTPMQRGPAWRSLSQQRSPEHLPKNLDRAWDIVASRVATRLPRRGRYLRRADAILALESQYNALSDEELQRHALELRQIFRRGREKKQNVHQALALIRETAARQLGLRPFREQVAAGLAMYDGHLAEVATGEGKTLAAVMPATLLGWRGKGCHIMTVNDYLAKRDAAWMGPVYERCGVSIGHVESEMGPDQRRAAYRCDVTYATSREVAADFLRDRLASAGRRDLAQSLLRDWVEQTSRTQQAVIPSLAYAVVDEADSVLIDEAVTPLLIAGEAPNTEQSEAYTQAAELASSTKASITSSTRGSARCA
jgi:preprotein translocase subunit SecA